jgi:hypothetical protein
MEMGELDECPAPIKVIVGYNGVSGVIFCLQGVFANFVSSLVRGLVSPDANLCFDCSEQMKVAAAALPTWGVIWRTSWWL